MMLVISYNVIALLCQCGSHLVSNGPVKTGSSTGGAGPAIRL